MDERPTYIYVLCEPDGETVRYVGKTVDLEQRFSDHLKVPERKRRTYKENWVASLLAVGARPVMRVVEEVPPGGDWAEAETRWIDYYRKAGARLTNHTNGGEGVPGLKLSEESKRKIAESKHGRHYPKISAAKKGQGLGVPRSEETKRRMSEGRRGIKMTDEGRRHVSEGSSRWNDERRLPDGWTTESFEDYVVETYARLGAWEPCVQALKESLGCAPSFYRAKRLLIERGVWVELVRSSQYRGVGWDKSKQRWSVKISVKNKTVNVGRFDNEEDAARAYNEAALRYFGDKAKLNDVPDKEVTCHSG